MGGKQLLVKEHQMLLVISEAKGKHDTDSPPKSLRNHRPVSSLILNF